MVRSMPVALLGALSALSPVAVAQTDEPILVRVQESMSCTNAGDFFGRVHRRAPVARPARGGEPARVFTLAAEPFQATVRGHLVVNHLDGSQSSRTVEGASCDEVVDALALVVALDIDPHAASSVAPDGPMVARDAPGRAPPPEVVISPEPTPGEPALPWRLGAGVELSLAHGVVPVSLVSLPVYLELRRPSRRLFSPSFALGFERTFDATLVGAEGDATLRIIQGFALGCPLVFQVGPARLEPCTRLEVGALEGAGELGKQVVAPNRERRAWAALGVLGRAGARVYGGLDANAQFGLGVPLVPRYELQLDPTPSLGRVGAWHWRASVGLSLRFL
jgi:hypothetical protein